MHNDGHCPWAYYHSDKEYVPVQPTNVTENKSVTVTVTIPKADIHKYFTTTLYHKPPVNDGKELRLKSCSIDSTGGLMLVYTNK